MSDRSLLTSPDKTAMRSPEQLERENSRLRLIVKQTQASGEAYAHKLSELHRLTTDERLYP